ncbi:hypothetical protein PENSOL_c015G01402 [Penicillium solitum]|uniref:GAG-pre-integrase domain-containing protein n=1 Tax=Penicillium solitum TaxID=60172 RepID=A0A1V6R540_9EURO|nr:uncharacterized protein PENSOL_c015G01402 [Penicillium solitum]OQD96628.1 hypothetical protein PENSOL_c015G01402 [Penicillium solitum]
MADAVDSESEGDTGPHPSVPSTNPIDPNAITSDDATPSTRVVSIRGWSKKPSHQGQRLPTIAAVKIQKVGILEYNETDPSAWKQSVFFQLTPHRLEWLIDSDIPRPEEEDVTAECWYYWSRLVASWMYLQIDKTLQSKLRTLPEIPTLADEMCDMLMSLTQGGDRMQSAEIDMKKYDTMKRSDYNSASDYIDAFRRQYHALARFKVAPHPSHALSLSLRNLDSEIKKVQFIREEIASLEPKKLDLAKAASVIEGTSNAVYNNASRGRGSGRGGRGGNRGGRSGHNDKTESKDKDKDAVDDDTNKGTAVKKKKRGLRKQPPDGKDIHEYAREMRNGSQKDEANTMCSFCGFSPHPAKRCAYLSSNPPAVWEPSGNLWAYSKAIQRAQRQPDGQSNIIVAAAKAVDRCDNWLLDTGSDKILTYDLDDFHTYQIDRPEDAYAYKDYSGNRVITLGYGEVMVRAALPDGGEYTFITTGYYTPRGHGKLFGMQKLLDEQDISYDTRTKYLTNGQGDVLGYADTLTGVPYLVSPKDDNDLEDASLDSDDKDDIGYVNQVQFDDPNKANPDPNDYDPNDIGYDPDEIVGDPDDTLPDPNDFDLGNMTESEDNNNVGFVSKVTAYDIHRRLGHAGKARIASTLHHTEQLGDEEQYGTEQFDCDACLLGKSKLKISRQPQTRVQDARWKFYVDTQPIKPTGPNGESY